MNENHVWSLDADGEPVSRPSTAEELQEARDEATELARETEGSCVAMRSCWDCNPAHAHFLDGDWGDWVLACVMGCGRYFFRGVDITVAEPSAAATP